MLNVCVVFTLLVCCTSVHAALKRPFAPAEVPKDFVEPEYSNSEDGTLPKYVTIFLGPPEFLDMGPAPEFKAMPQMPPAPFRFADANMARNSRLSLSSRLSGSAVPASASSSSAAASSGSSSGADPSLFFPPHLAGVQTPMIPGPWFGSYSTRMDELGFSIPPYAFDPAHFQRLGPYRALTNKYSDGTSYPLNMGKFDYFPMGAEPGLFGTGAAPIGAGAGGAAAAPAAAPAAPPAA